MLWLLLALLAYFFGAITHLLDKYLVKKTFPNPWILTFYVSLLGGIAILTIPFLGIKNFHYNGFANLVFDLSAGLIYTTAFLLFFICLKKEEVSRVAPFVGGLTALFIFALSAPLLGERLTQQQLISFIFIIAGSLLLSLENKKSGFLPSSIFILAIFCSLFFGLGHIMSKMSYLSRGFINGFVWIRLGTLLGAIILLLSPHIRKNIAKDIKQPKEKGAKTLLLLGGQACGALNFLLFNLAFLIGPIALVNGLQGLQYGLLFLLVWLISLKFPAIIKERFTKKIVTQKIVSIILIAIGVGILAI